MAKKREEAVTATFHFLERVTDEGVSSRFSEAQFKNLAARISSLPKLDLNDKWVAERVKAKFMAPLGSIKLVDARTAFGEFEAAYSGHAYQNHMKGKIPAESINLRPFFYLLYLTEKGRIIIGAQYLGLYGGYEGLKNTICDFLGDPSTIKSHVIRLGASSYRNAKPVAVNINVANRPSSIAKGSSFGQRAAVTFKKLSADDGFEEHVAQSVFPAIEQGSTAIRNAVAALANETDLMTISESDIEDATIIALVGNKRRVIHLIEAGHAATRFHLNVKLNDDGHPDADPTETELVRVLEEDILDRIK